MAKRKPNNFIINEDGTVLIELRRKNKENLWTIIDKENLEDVIKLTWIARYNHANGLYYASHTIYDTNIKNTSGAIDLQCYILNRNKDSNITVDHINHDTLDNRISNLRKAITKENTRHRKGRNSNNKSGYRNVCMVDGKWLVQLQINGKNTRLGSFDDVDEAGAFAKRMRSKYYGEFQGES